MYKIISEYLAKIKDFFIWFNNLEMHNELWEEIGPI